MSDAWDKAFEAMWRDMQNDVIAFRKMPGRRYGPPLTREQNEAARAEAWARTQAGQPAQDGNPEWWAIAKADRERGGR